MNKAKPSRYRPDNSRKKFLNRMVTCPGFAGEEMAAEAAEQSDQYQATLAKLNKFNKGSKQKAKLQCYKKEWTEEWLQLQSSAQRLETDLDVLLDHQITKSDDDIETYPFEEHLQAKRDLHVAVSDISGHWREIKESNRKLVQISNSLTHEGYTQEEMNIQRVHLANRLLELHQWNAGCQSALDITEANLTAEVMEAKKQVFRTVERDTDFDETHDEEVKSILALLGELPPSARREEEEEGIDGDKSTNKAEEVTLASPLKSETDVEYEILLVRSEISEKIQEIVRKREEAKVSADNEWLRSVKKCLGEMKGVEVLDDNTTILTMNDHGWNQKDHEAFEIEYKQMVTAGRPRDRILDRLSNTYAKSYNRKEVHCHILWIEACLALLSRKRNIQEEFKRNRSLILTLAKQRFNEARNEIMLNKERLIELAETKARCESLKLRLDELRPIRDKANLEEMRILKEKEEMKQMELMKLAQIQEVNQKKKREAVNKYHEEKKAKELLKKKQEEEEAILREAQLEAQRSIDNMRVEYRSEKRKEQIASVQAIRWQAQVREARRLESIAQIAASVPYFDTINNLVADPLKPTAASDGWAGTFDGDTFRKDPNAMQQGYSDKKLFANKGFRLGVELRAAGVHESKAAAAVIKAACPVSRTPYAIS
mmetsp:Transcript_37556/g.48580  ORF Transcript_37556/g.48580 Transcript_37556/m.48580 type:complete len:657 (+) Transcript_37556:49-2019(+)